jgi:UDP:flavonoid glycosyltransferase YjiC (YdhE family)
MGTVSRALAHGLPLLCIPIGRDQSDIAARVRWHGAGLSMRPNSSDTKMRAALHRVLSDASFREAAEQMRDAIQNDLGTARGVAELEALGDLGQASHD